MALPAKRLIEEASKILNDFEEGFEFTRWSKADLLDDTSKAIAALHFFKPDLFVKRVALTLTEGSAQTLPPEYAQLRDITYNVASGGKQGSPISKSNFETVRLINRDICYDPLTPYKTKTFRIDPQAPRTFYVNPPAPAYPKAQVIASVVEAPQAVLNENDDIVFPAGDAAQWQNILLDFILYRAFNRDIESAASRTKSRDHEIAFMQAVGAKFRLDRLQEAAPQAGGSQ